MIPDCFAEVSSELLATVGLTDLRPRFLNSAWERTLGFPRDTLMDQPVTALVHPADLERALSALRSAQPAGRLADVETRFRCHDGAYKWISWNAVLDATKGLIYAAGLDISRQRMASLRIADALELNRRILDTSGCGIAAAKAGGQCIVANTAMARIMGETSAQDILRQNFREMPSWKQAGLVDLADEVLASGVDARREVRVTTRLGREVWIDVHFGRFMAGGQPHLLVTATNLTDLKQALSAADSANLAMRTVRNLMEPVFVADTEGRILQVNQAVTDVFGHGPELIGHAMETLVAEEDRPALQAACHRCREQGLVRDLEITVIHGNGRRVPASLSCNTIPDAQGRPDLVLIMVRDMTERRQTELALRESEERYRTLAEAAQDMIFMVGPDFRVRYANSSAHAVFRARADRLEGMRLDELFPPAIAERQQRSLTAVFETGQPAVYVNQVVFPSHTMWMESILVPLRDSAGHVQAVMGIGRDVTERVRLEEELKRSNAELQQFAYAASHDLQEPLRMVASYVQLLAQRYQGKLDSDADEFIAFAVDGALRMQQMIKDLLAFSQVGVSHGETADVSLEDVLKEALDNLQLSASESGAVVTHDPLPSVHAERAQMVQLFQNLIGNSIKFRSQAPPRVHIAAQPEGPQWRIRVHDNGIGIAPKHFERIFVVFKRLHEKHKYPGTGIGLALCRKIVERHGGRIGVESEEGHGSTFHFTLPAPGEKSQIRPPSVTEHERRGGTGV